MGLLFCISSPECFCRPANDFRLVQGHNNKKPLFCSSGAGSQRSDRFLLSLFPPLFREVVVNPTWAGVLTRSASFCIEPTVARQRRTYTGFAIKPSLPGVQVPRSFDYSVVFIIVSSGALPSRNCWYFAACSGTASWREFTRILLLSHNLSTIIPLTGNNWVIKW